MTEKTNANTDESKAGAVGIKRPQGGGSATTQGGKAEAIGTKKPQRGEDRRQYREKRLRL